MNITRDEIWVIIYYDYKRRLSRQEYLESLQKIFDDSCVARTTMYNWHAEFYWRRDHFKVESRANRPRSTVTPENVEAARQLISVDLHITYQQIQDTLRIGSAVTESILHDYLGFRKTTD